MSASPKMKPCKAEPSPTAKDAVDILRVIIRAFTNHHKDLRISWKEIGRRLIISIHCHPQDHPKVVGMGGRQIWSLKNVIMARVGNRIRRDIEIYLHDPPSRAPAAVSNFKLNPNWNRAKVETIFRGVLGMILRNQFSYRVLSIDEGVSGIEFEVHKSELDDVRGDVTQALKNIFNVIGRHEGHNLVVELLDAEPADEPPAIEGIEMVEKRPVPRIPDDDIAQEARERGFSVD